MSKLCKVMYLLSEEGRKASLLGGGDGKEIQCIATDINEDILKLARVTTDGEAYVTIGFKNYSYNDYLEGKNLTSSNWMKNIDAIINTKVVYINWRNFYEPYIEKVSGVKRFDKPQTVEQLIEFQNNITEYVNKKIIEELTPRYEELFKKYEEEKRPYEEAEIRAKKEKEIKQKEEEARKEERKRLKEESKKEDFEWIEKYGSDYLKSATKLGYNCQRKYMEERVEKEFPDFDLDFDDNAYWKERVSPSQEALDEVTKWLDRGFDSQIVWLTQSVNGSEYDYENDFEEREAIVINFKEYWLVKEM